MWHIFSEIEFIENLNKSPINIANFNFTHSAKTVIL